MGNYVIIILNFSYIRCGIGKFIKGIIEYGKNLIIIVEG